MNIREQVVSALKHAGIEISASEIKGRMIAIQARGSQNITTAVVQSLHADIGPKGVRINIELDEDGAQLILAEDGGILNTDKFSYSPKNGWRVYGADGESSVYITFEVL